jgi:predicted ribosome quality control (RQC) complex YloA/Tae2 family protein
VPLDPKLSPAENVERLFERARKAARARPALEERRRFLDGLIERVEAGEAVPEAQLPGRSKERDTPRRAYRTFTSLDGRRILVGKGGRDNDETTLRVAGPHDLFLHVRGVPGAHVIIPLRRDEAPPEQALLDAAHLALHYSKRRNASAAEITYTRRKHVSKPRGAKPGLVSVRQEKVLHLRREPARLARLLMTVGEGE